MADIVPRSHGNPTAMEVGLTRNHFQYIYAGLSKRVVSRPKNLHHTQGGSQKSMMTTRISREARPVKTPKTLKVYKSLV